MRNASKDLIAFHKTAIAASLENVVDTARAEPGPLPAGARVQMPTRRAACALVPATNADTPGWKVHSAKTPHVHMELLLPSTTAAHPT